MSCNKLSKGLYDVITDLQLPTRPYQQDFEFEVSDPDRVFEFIEYYQNNDLDDYAKETLMCIIVDSANDCFAPYNENFGNRGKLEMILKELLLKEYNLHETTIIYFCLFDEEIEDEEDDCLFEITKFIRTIYAQANNKC